MKLVHLSDLHLGKRVNEFSMLEDQQYILTEILQIIDREQPDGVLIAGDVYDKSVPSAEAVALLDDFLVRLSKRNLQVFIISGNHDSPERIAFGGRLMAQSGVHITPVYNGTVVPLTLTDEYGPVDIYLLPFLKPAHVRRFFPEREIITYTDAISAAIETMNADPARRNVLVTHQFVTGATRCDSEEISVGGADNVDVSVFDAFDYVALGHIHGPQQVGRETVRYCGTPLKYSFSEVKQQKSLTVVELSTKGSFSLRTIPLVPMRDMAELRGTYEELTFRGFYEGTSYRKDYVDAPTLAAANGQLATCQEEVAEVLKQLHQHLLDLEVQLTRREELGQEIQIQEIMLTQLTAQQEELRSTITQAEVAQSKLRGQQEQLEDKIRRQLQGNLEGCALDGSLERITTRLQDAEQALTHIEEQLHDIEIRLARKRDLETLIPQREQNLNKLAHALSAAREELIRSESRREALKEQIDTLQEALLYSDTTAAEARRLALQAEAESLSNALKTAEEDYNACKTSLAGMDAAIQELSKLLEASEDVDMVAQQARSRELSKKRSETAEMQRSIHTRRTTNETALKNIQERAATLNELEAKYTWVRTLSNTVNGNLPGKEKIALETYIQMTFFDRILQRANVRFLVMSGGQYELKRRREAENNRSQSGLELDVIDHYNGSERSVKSLSGGESFKASLSLALGLSDEIQSAAGGIRLDTMFVDEGFGSLDEESLQQAIRALTGLTEGNRLVGIISHVVELREKIDKQIVVTKDKTGGSRVEIVV